MVRTWADMARIGLKPNIGQICLSMASRAQGWKVTSGFATRDTMRQEWTKISQNGHKDSTDHS